MKPRRAFFTRYSQPRVDSPRAIASATMHLVSARSIDGLNVDAFAHQKRLKIATAERLIAKEKMRRAGHG